MAKKINELWMENHLNKWYLNGEKMLRLDYNRNFLFIYKKMGQWIKCLSMYVLQKIVFEWKLNEKWIQNGNQM